MSNEVNLTSNESIDTSKDSVVIQNLIEDLPGGVSLDVTGVTEDVLHAGRVIINETATGVKKPLAISGGSYVALPAGHTYAGILVASCLTAKAMVSVLVRGTVNNTAIGNFGDIPAVPSGAITALPLIRFV